MLVFKAVQPITKPCSSGGGGKSSNQTTTLQTLYNHYRYHGIFIQTPTNLCLNTFLFANSIEM